MKVDSWARHARLHARAFDLLAEHKGILILLATLMPRIRDLRDDPQGRHAGRVPDREPRADVDAAADEAAQFLRPRHPGRDRPAGADPGRHGPSLSAPPRRQGAGRLSEAGAGKGARKTLGVPLFQEQAMQVAIECAGFTPGEADQLRRAMATFKFTGGVSASSAQAHLGHGRARLSAGFAENDLQPDRRLRQLRLSREPRGQLRQDRLRVELDEMPSSRRLLRASLLNAQPMGFYAPAQIVRDAREHGVEMRPVCVNASRWDCTLAIAK
jgi:error-prone DNA polymerase